MTEKYWTRTLSTEGGKLVMEDHPPGWAGVHVIGGKEWPVYREGNRLYCRSPICPVCSPLT